MSEISSAKMYLKKKSPASYIRPLYFRKRKKKLLSVSSKELIRVKIYEDEEKLHMHALMKQL